MSKKIFLALILLIFTIWLVSIVKKSDIGIKEIVNFDECVAAGNSVMESYPRQCRAEGKTFVENIGNELEKADLIRLSNPRPNQIITSPLTIRGEARGFWFFEATFPVVLTDWDGRIIAESYATAQEEWMTEEFVQFEAVLEFKKTDYMNNGLLILRKDNPSDLPEYDDALEIPIIFADVYDHRDKILTCTDEQRQTNFCIGIYKPVCAEVNVQCITTPCPPIKETFPNSCKACQNSLVEYYTTGEC